MTEIFDNIIATAKEGAKLEGGNFDAGFDYAIGRVVSAFIAQRGALADELVQISVSIIASYLLDHVNTCKDDITKLQKKQDQAALGGNPRGALQFAPELTRLQHTLLHKQEVRSLFLSIARQARDGDLS